MARLPRPTIPLELRGAEFRELVGKTMERLVPWLDSISTQPSNALDGGQKVARSFDEPMPENGHVFGQILGRLFDRAITTSLNAASPGYLAYIPGGGLPTTAIADLITDVTNRYTGLWMPAPGLVQLEISVIRWFCAMVGYGERAGGWLCSGGSMANLCAIVAGREAKLGEDFRDGILYTSDQAHHSLLKAARIVGFPKRNVRVLPAGKGFRMDLEALAKAVKADRDAGLRPFFVALHAGSTPVGAVDDLSGIADFCAEQGMWTHVDAAYGGFFMLTERGQAMLAGIKKADSITLDPHKGLFLPYGTGCLLVKERETLRSAFAESAAYLPPSQEDDDRWDFADFGPELSRPARGLRVWLPLQLHGAGAFREALNEKLDLARYAVEKVAAMKGVRVISAPELSLFTCRIEPEGMVAEDADSFNRRVMSRVNQKKRVMLTGVPIWDATIEKHVFVIRVCVLCFRTHQDRIDMMLEDLSGAIVEVQAGSS